MGRGTRVAPSAAKGLHLGPVLRQTSHALRFSAPACHLHVIHSFNVPRPTSLPLVPSNTAVQDLEDKVAKLQRAVYYLIWKRTGFGEQCVHCGHSYPGHAERCKAAEVEALVR